MAKAKKSAVDSGRKSVEVNVDEVDVDEVDVDEVPPMPVMPFDPGVQFAQGRDMLFDLFVARVAKAETVQTVRRDGKAIFRDAYYEAKCALEVYEEMTSKR